MKSTGKVACHTVIKEPKSSIMNYFKRCSNLRGVELALLIDYSQVYSECYL